MIEMGKKYRTRDGRPVRVLCTDRKSLYPVVALIMNRDAQEAWQGYKADGSVYDSSSSFDLIEVQPVIEWWQNVWPDMMKEAVTQINHKTREDTKRVFCSEQRTHLVHFTYDPNTNDLKVEVERA
jgi:hypothetical protein